MSQRRKKSNQVLGKLKKLMKKRFLPNNYKQDLFLKLNSIRQQEMSIEEYIKEFEQLKMRCEVLEVLKQTIAHFPGGMNREITNINEIQPYWSFERRM